MCTVLLPPSVNPNAVNKTYHIVSSLGLRRLRDDYEVQASMGLNSEKQKQKNQKGLKQLTVISHLFNTPKSLYAQLL
jgi:hypothetical protein